MEKRGAIELSTSTIIVVILAVAMLILGLTLVRTVMCGSIIGVSELNEKIKQQLSDLFTEQSNIVVKEASNEIQKGEDYYGVAFGVRNTLGKDSTFSYTVEAIDLGSCKMNKVQAENLISIGKNGKTPLIRDGESDYDRIVMNVPATTEMCNLRYRINVKSGAESYGSADFDVRIVGKKISGYVC